MEAAAFAQTILSLLSITLIMGACARLKRQLRAYLSVSRR